MAYIEREVKLFGPRIAGSETVPTAIERWNKKKFEALNWRNVS